MNQPFVMMMWTIQGNSHYYEFCRNSIKNSFRSEERKIRKKQFRLDLQETFANTASIHRSNRSTSAETESKYQRKIKVKGEGNKFHSSFEKKKSDKNSARNLYSDEGLIGYQIGDLVAISGQERGVIQYLGSVHFQVNHKFTIFTNNDITLSAWNLGWCGAA